MPLLALRDVDVERAARDGDLEAVGGRLESWGAPLAVAEPVLVRAVGVQLQRPAGGRDPDRRARRPRDVDAQRATVDAHWHDPFRRGQVDVDAARAGPAVEGRDLRRREVELATDRARAALDVPRD